MKRGGGQRVSGILAFGPSPRCQSPVCVDPAQSNGEECAGLVDVLVRKVIFEGHRNHDVAAITRDVGMPSRICIGSAHAAAIALVLGI